MIVGRMDEKKGEVKDINFEDYRGSYHVSLGEDGTMPFIKVHTKTLPKAWELAVLSCWKYGISIATHYDKLGDPPSKEATIMVCIDNAFNEPRIHKNFPGSIEKLEEYTQEVIDGIHDHWINPLEGKWTYTYHNRLFNYNFSIGLKKENMGKLLDKGIDQIADVRIELKRDITSKAAQATTWIPGADIKMPGDRPCLQRLWFRVLENKDKEAFLNLNTYWRSRDLYKAWPMNVYAITELQKKVAEELSNEIKREIKVGSYMDISDSLHIYGSYWKDEKFQDDIRKMENEPLEKRVWNSNEQIIKDILQEAKENLVKDPDFYAKGGS